MKEPLWVPGTLLLEEDQRYALSAFVHRHTRDHTPAWAKQIWKNGRPYPVQFASDGDWLAHSYFQVTGQGRLDKRIKHCNSYPTWPDTNGRSPE